MNRFEAQGDPRATAMIPHDVSAYKALTRRGLRFDPGLQAAVDRTGPVTRRDVHAEPDHFPPLLQQKGLKRFLGLLMLRLDQFAGHTVEAPLDLARRRARRLLERPASGPPDSSTCLSEVAMIQ